MYVNFDEKTFSFSFILVKIHDIIKKNIGRREKEGTRNGRKE